MSIGVHIGPFWISSGGRRKRRINNTCRRCHLLPRQPRKALCTECEASTKEEMIVKGVEALNIYEESMKNADVVVKYDMLKESLHLFKRIRNLEQYGFSLTIGNGRSSADWIIDVHRAIDNVKREAKASSNKQSHDLALITIIESELTSALSCFKDAMSLDYKRKKYHIEQVIAIFNDIKIQHPILIKKIIIFDHNVNEWMATIKQEYKTVKKEWKYIQ